MARKQGISSVLELSRYSIGETVWWVVLRDSDSTPIIPEKDQWMEGLHPKTLYERGAFQRLWTGRCKLPKLQHMDFQLIISLLTSKLSVEPFTVAAVTRSNDTAEFYYCNTDEEWMPETNLFDTDAAARRERNRIMKLIKKWAVDQTA